MDMYIRYGGRDQFENRVLDPSIRDAAKAALSKFTADQMAKNREKVRQAVVENLRSAMANLPITVVSPQLENLILPRAYMEAVKAKQIAEQKAVAENHRLAQQKLIAQREVNTANARAESVRIAADAEAYRVTKTAEAEAEAIRMVNVQLAKSPRYIELANVKQWDGVLPVTYLGNNKEGGGTGIFLTMPSPKKQLSRSDTRAEAKPTVETDTRN